MKTKLIILLTCLPLVACGSNVALDQFETVERLMFGSPDDSISLKEAASIPYASKAARIGNGPAGMLVLGKAEADRLSWYSADNLEIVTRHGRLIGIKGLQEGFTVIDPIMNDPLGSPAPLSGSADVEMFLDVFPERGYGLRMACRLKPFGMDRLSQRDAAGRLQTWDVQLLQEECQIDTLDWVLTNHYMRDTRSGRVLRSRHEYSPSFPPIFMQTVRPFSG